MKCTTIGVDLAKNVFQVAVSRHPGKVAECHRLTRSQFVRFFAQRKPALVVLEACGTSHFWARELQRFGHQVLLLPPHQVRVYVSRNKTDEADAKALLEAHRNEEIREVPVKSVAQQTLTALHRLRSTWMADRTARINLVRGLLREMGFSIPAGAGQLVPRAMVLLDDPASGLPDPLRLALAEACLEVREFEARVRTVERQLEALAAQTPMVARLRSVPGVGLLTATAMVAIVGDVGRFPTSRHFASFLGLTPRERSSGERRRLGAISKRGNVYLPTLLIHGARSVMFAAKRIQRPDQLRAWALRVERLRGHNKATVGLANKLARIIWAIWKTESSFESRVLAA